MTSPEQLGNYLNRRSFLGSSGIGVGSAALFSLLGRDALGRKIDTSYDGLPGLPHHDARIKRVIFLTMAGGPSHLETFDYKRRVALYPFEQDLEYEAEVECVHMT